jgi:hypothetical protein
MVDETPRLSALAEEGAAAGAGTPMIVAAALVAEAIRPDGGWVAVGQTPGGLWVVLARLDASAWVRFFSSQEEAMARFLEYANLELGLDGEIRPTTRLVVRRPADFRPPSREAWRRIGGERWIARREGSHERA